MGGVVSCSDPCRTRATGCVEVCSQGSSLMEINLAILVVEVLSIKAIILLCQADVILGGGGGLF